MPIVAVGGSGRNVGKTSLICGIVRALPALQWTAVKVTSHRHGKRETIWEETQAGQEADTARYLAAGAHRAFLLSAPGAELSFLVRQLQASIEAPAHLILESNRIVDYLRPDICLAAMSRQENEPKPSFGRFAHLIDATVVRSAQDRANAGARPLFELADFEHISSAMQDWLRERLPTVTSREREL